MPTYFFHITAEPLPGNQQTDDIQGALAQIWLIAGDPHQAEQKALALVSAYGWAPLKVEDSFAVLPGILAGADAQFLTQYEKAQSSGHVVIVHFMARESRAADIKPVPLIKPPENLLQ